MEENFPLDLKRTTADTGTMARAVALALAEGRVVPVGLRAELFSTIEVAASLLESLEELKRRSEVADAYETARIRREKRQAKLDEERRARLAGRGTADD